MDLGDYALAVRRHPVVALVVLLSVLALGGAYLATARTVWVARASVALDVTGRESSRDLAEGVDLALGQVPAVARLAVLPSVLGPAGSDVVPPATAHELARTTSVEADLGSPVVVVAVEAGDPQEAADRAVAVAGRLADAVSQVSPSGADQLAVSATVLPDAQVPRTPASPRRSLTAVVATLGAVVAALVAAVVVDAPARHRRSPTPGSVPPLLGRGARLPLPAGRPGRHAGGRWGAVGLAPGLRTASSGGVLAVCVLGRSRARGRAQLLETVVAALPTGRRVLVLDAVPVRPRGRRGLDGDERSLSRIPSGVAPLDELVRSGAGPGGADLVVAGRGERWRALADLDPAVLRDVLRTAREDYDVVLVVAPAPVGSTRAASGLVLAGATDEVLLAARGRGAQARLAEAGAALEVSGARPHGLLLR